MKLVTTLLFVIASLSITQAHADKDGAKGKSAKYKEAARSEKMQNMHKEDDDESYDVHHDKLEDRAKFERKNTKRLSAKQRSEMRDAHKGVKGSKGVEMRDEKMNEHARQAVSRRDESKQIKQDYRDAVKSGESERIKGKKPWWKFWGADEEV